MAKSTNLEINKSCYNETRSANLLRRRLLQSKVNGTGDRSPVQPAICIHPNCETLELFEVAWFVNGFEQRKEPYKSVSIRSVCNTRYIPVIPIAAELLEGDSKTILGLNPVEREIFDGDRNSHKQQMLRNSEKSKWRSKESLTE